LRTGAVVERDRFGIGTNMRKDSGVDFLSGGFGSSAFDRQAGDVSSNFDI
jgi:hypothetical protein